jgi:hypothetical protein
MKQRFSVFTTLLRVTSHHEEGSRKLSGKDNVLYRSVMKLLTVETCHSHLYCKVQGVIFVGVQPDSVRTCVRSYRKDMRLRNEFLRTYNLKLGGAER